MLIVEPSTTSVKSWADPMVALTTEHFRRLRGELESFGADGIDDKNLRLRAAQTSADACDLSRQILFRLHRVSREQLRTLIEEYGKAADAIDSWANIDQFDDPKLVKDYANHIRSRAELLSKQVY